MLYASPEHLKSIWSRRSLLKASAAGAQVGTMDVALAMEALGHKKFGDKGNMTKAEIDFLIDYVIPLKKAGPPRKRGSHPPAGGGGHGLLRHHGYAAA